MAGKMVIAGIPQEVGTVAVDGFIPAFNGGSIIPAGTNARLSLYLVSTDTSGNWSQDLTAAAFTGAVYGFCQGISTGMGNQTQFEPLITSSPTALTSISGRVVTPTAAVIGNLPFVAANKVVSFYLLVVGW